MDAMLPTTLGKLKILCSLPFFSDAVCIRSQSAAEHAFTNILLSIALTAKLELPEKEMCEAIELAIFAEVPKAYLGDPSFYLRKRHKEVESMYEQVRGRLWLEAESATGISATRSESLCGLHALIDSFSAMLFIEKESTLGNGFFQAERFKTRYHSLRKRALNGENLDVRHPAAVARERGVFDLSGDELGLPLPGRSDEPWTPSVRFWKDAAHFLDELFDEAKRALCEDGIGAYSATFIGMIEKLKQHFRYKGWTYHHKESVGEHTYQVVFICRFLAESLGLNAQEKIHLYRAAAFHDLAEAYASDVVYPVKVREKDLGLMHAAIEEKILKEVTERLGFELANDSQTLALVDIADRFSAQIYFDRERRSGNTNFNVSNVSMVRVKEKYLKEDRKSVV